MFESPCQSHPAPSLSSKIKMRQGKKPEFQGGFNKRGCRVVSSVILDVRIFFFFFFLCFLHPLLAHACNSVLTLHWETCLYNYDLMVDCIDSATGGGMVFLSSFSWSNCTAKTRKTKDKSWASPRGSFSTRLLGFVVAVRAESAPGSVW